MKTLDEFIYRIATRSDAPGIFAVLKAVADEIPVFLDTKERLSALRMLSNHCLSANESVVALGSSDDIVGFILVAPDELERFQLENDALHLHYAGVKKEQRRRGIFRALVAKVVERGAPLTATVKNANQSQMASRLEALGFRLSETRSDERRYRRE
jgi:ribosomal protein S18 acetylase RimI-like enzyme